MADDPDLTNIPAKILEAIARSLEKSADDLVHDDLRLVTELDLGGTQVTDVAPLTGLVNLHELRIGGTPVTEDQKQALKKALPGLTIQD